jgi:hypothetical protein
MGAPAKAFVKGHPTEWEPVSHLQPMPFHPGAVVVTQNGRRRFLNDKLARGMGAPKEWVQEWHPTSLTLKQAISLHHLLEHLTPILLQPSAVQPISSPEVLRNATLRPECEFPPLPKTASDPEGNLHLVSTRSQM